VSTGEPAQPAGADSSGTPWVGRDLPPSPYADDDGQPDARLAAALARWSGRPAAEPAVVAALARARLFVAVAALPGEETEMAVMTVTEADGRRALPVFTSPATLAAWAPTARPVPAPGRRAAMSAVAEGCDLLDVDRAGPVHYVVRRPAVWAIGRGLAWTPSYANRVVAQEISTICAAEGVTGRSERGSGAELRVVVDVPADITALDAQELVARLSDRLAQSDVVAECVDSLELTLARGPGRSS
jgi:hypothetical protein